MTRDPDAVERRAGTPLFQVDAFAERPFCGNPAAVCLLERGCDDSWMQAVAREMNLSETAFVRREGDGFDLRWFTPTKEVVLCGHATLASAHVLWEEGAVAANTAVLFHTKSGPLIAQRDGAWIVLDFPAAKFDREEVPGPSLAALGVSVRYAVRTDLFYLAEVGSEEEVRAVVPDMKRLASLDRVGVIVTARSEAGGIDFVSRFFAPAFGIDEDPVTGSAHCALGPYWARRLGSEDLVGYQASPRGGVVRVRVRGEGIGDGRVQLLGRAVTVLCGTLVEGRQAPAEG